MSAPPRMMKQISALKHSVHRFPQCSPKYCLIFQTFLVLFKYNRTNYPESQIYLETLKINKQMNIQRSDNSSNCDPQLANNITIIRHIT